MAVCAEKVVKCTTCRECLRSFQDCVYLAKDPKHFLFTVESTGSISTEQIVLDALDILKEKCVKWRKTLNEEIGTFN